MKIAEQSNKNAVIYARYSSEKQNEQSIEGQIDEILQFANREGYNIIDTYIDRAMTGRSDDRPSFQKMIGDSKNHIFQYVIVYKLDRFSRNRYDSAIYKRVLKNEGVKVISAMENISDTPEGIILESMLEGYSEYYSKELAQKVIRGNRESRKKGYFTGGRVIYGFHIENKKYVLNPDEGEVVKRIFSEVLNGKKMSWIAENLNKECIPYTQGEKWDTKKIARLLKNEKYTGIVKVKDETYDNIVPGIINHSVYDEVQKKLRKNKHRNRTLSPGCVYFLSNKMYCGICGAPICGKSGKKRKGRQMYHYYVCKGRREHRCDMDNIKKDWIENLVAKLAIEYLLAPARRDDAAKKMCEFFNANSEQDAKIRLLEGQQKEIGSKLGNMMKAIQNGLYSTTMNSLIAEMEVRQSQIEKELLRVKSTRKECLSLQSCKAFLASFSDLDIKKEENKEIIIRHLVKAVYIDKENVKVVFYPSEEITIKARKDTFEIYKEEGIGNSPPPFSLGSPSDYNSNSYAITRNGFVFHYYLNKRFKDWFVLLELPENLVKSGYNKKNPQKKK